MMMGARLATVNRDFSHKVHSASFVGQSADKTPFVLDAHVCSPPATEVLPGGELGEPERCQPKKGGGARISHDMVRVAAACRLDLAHWASPISGARTRSPTQHPSASFVTVADLRKPGSEGRREADAMDGSLDRSGEDVFRAYMGTYCEAWNREDLDAIVETYHLPCFIYRSGTLHALLDAESKRNYFGGWIEVNRNEGPATWEMLTFSLTGLGRNSALVTARWVFRRPDGSLIWDFVDSHHFCRFDGRWKFLDRTLHD